MLDFLIGLAVWDGLVLAFCMGVWLKAQFK